MQALKVKNFKSGFAGLAPLAGAARPCVRSPSAPSNPGYRPFAWGYAKDPLVGIVKIPLFHRKVSFIHILVTSFPQFVTSAKADLHLIVYNSIYYAELCRLRIF